MADERYPVADPVTGTVRQCAAKCATCIFRPGIPARFAPGRIRSMIRDAIAGEGHIVCHATLDTVAPAICAGYAEHPQAAERSFALRAVRSGAVRLQLVNPPAKGTQ